jgi:hypothetical protein
MERLAVSKYTMHEFHSERFNLKKLNAVEVIEKYWVQISNWFAALENSYNDMDINRAWETKGEYQNFSQRESRLL